MQPALPRPLTHVGIAVPDVDAAMDWYKEVLSFDVLAEPRTIQPSDGESWRTARLLVGEEFETLRVGQLATGNQVGLEVFEFDATGGPAETTPSDGGYFHIGVIDPDIEGLAAKIDDHGGDHYSEIVTYAEDDVRGTYCMDPWGNRIEIYTKSWERFQLTMDDESE
jgi:catechol 2,3-dioxygenase-like lactoylglutathione lyase family enzyme